MSPSTRRSTLIGLLAAAAFGLPAQAQQAPALVKLVVPYPPGGSVDTMARLLQQPLQEQLKTTVVVENRPGAGGNIGADAVAKSPADGHAILLMDVTTLATNPALFPRLSYKPSDLAPVSMVIYAPYILGVANNLPVRDAAGLGRASCRERV